MSIGRGELAAVVQGLHAILPNELKREKDAKKDEKEQEKVALVEAKKVQAARHPHPAAVASEMDLEAALAQTKARLRRIPLNKFVKHLFPNDDSVLTRSLFVTTVTAPKLVRDSPPPSSFAVEIAQRLFDAMTHANLDDTALIAAHAEDEDPETWTLKHWEAVAALSIVCIDDREAVVDAVFAAFDADLNDTLELSEIERYLSIVLSFATHLEHITKIDPLNLSATATGSRSGLGLGPSAGGGAAAAQRIAGNERGRSIASAMVTKTFDDIDIDHSGSITKKELHLWLAKICGHPPG